MQDLLSMQFIKRGNLYANWTQIMADVLPYRLQTAAVTLNDSKLRGMVLHEYTY